MTSRQLSRGSGRKQTNPIDAARWAATHVVALMDRRVLVKLELQSTFLVIRKAGRNAVLDVFGTLTSVAVAGRVARLTAIDADAADAL